MNDQEIASAAWRHLAELVDQVDANDLRDRYGEDASRVVVALHAIAGRSVEHSTRIHTGCPSVDGLVALLQGAAWCAYNNGVSGCLGDGDLQVRGYADTASTQEHVVGDFARALLLRLLGEVRGRDDV